MNFLSSIITEEMKAEALRAGQLRAQATQENIVKAALAAEARKNSDAARVIEKNLKRKRDEDVDGRMVAYTASIALADDHENFMELNARTFLLPKSHLLCAFITSAGTRCQSHQASLRYIGGMVCSVDPDTELKYCSRHYLALVAESAVGMRRDQREKIDAIVLYSQDIVFPPVQLPVQLPVQAALRDLPPRNLPNDTVEPSPNALLRDIGAHVAASSPAYSDSGMDLE